MRRTRHATHLLLAAGLAFVAGRFTTPVGTPRAAAQPQHAADPAARDRALEALRQQATPGSRHRHLDPLIGEWEAEYTMRAAPDAPPVVARATVRREWVLGGRFVREVVRTEGPELAFEGLGFIGFDNFDGRYEFVWMDSLSTAMTVETGTYHPGPMVMHTRGEQRDPVTGRVIDAWSKLDLSDPDRHELIGYATDPDGHTFHAVEAVLTRRGPTSRAAPAGG